MIKILFITTGLTVGGAEVMLYNLLSGINREQFQPVVVSIMDRGTYGDRIEALDIPVYCLNMNEGKPSLEKFTKLIGLIRREQPDMIQGWMYHGNFTAQLASLIAGKKIPIIWSIHHSLNQLSAEKPLTQILIRLGSFTSKSVAKIAYVSEKSQQQHQKLGYSSQNGCCIPNGFNTKNLQPSEEIKIKFRQQLNLPNDAILIGMIARYHPMKDHANFLQAAQICLKKFPETHFILVGTNVDKQNLELTEIITKLNIRKQVHLLGERNDIPQITPALDILTSASAFGEAFPLVIGEAMACGVPCVATDIGDSATIIGDLGKIVPPKNPQAIAIAWQDLILLGTTVRKALGEKARKKILDYYSLESVVHQYENLYQHVII